MPNQVSASSILKFKTVNLCDLYNNLISNVAYFAILKLKGCVFLNAIVNIWTNMLFTASTKRLFHADEGYSLVWKILLNKYQENPNHPIIQFFWFHITFWHLVVGQCGLLQKGKASENVIVQGWHYYQSLSWCLILYHTKSIKHLPTHFTPQWGLS